MNPVKPGGIIVQKDGKNAFTVSFYVLISVLTVIGVSTVGEFFQERVRLAGIA
jgi:hypothetical protein